MARQSQGDALNRNSELRMRFVGSDKRDIGERISELSVVNSSGRAVRMAVDVAFSLTGERAWSSAAMDLQGIESLLSIVLIFRQ